MMFLKKPYSFGKIVLPSNIFYAPLAGCSDFPFRQIVSKYRPGLFYCEMVKMDALVRSDPGTFHMLDYEANMHPIGAQICGSKVEIAGKAAKMIEDLGFDVIDLNCGCPVDKVTKDGSGSGLLKTPLLIGDIVSEMVAAVDIPVTVKIRAGWNDQSICAAEITRIVEDAGATAITVHGRTREQGYNGPAHWDYIKQSKDAARSIQVIGNGDLFDGPSVLRMFEQTGCDAVLVARGTLGQPWIVEEIEQILEGKEPSQSCLNSKEAFLEHFTRVLDYQPDRRAVLDARRIGCWYFKKSPNTKDFRQQISKAQSVDEILQLIQGFQNEN